MIQVRLLGFNSRTFIETSEKGFLLSFYFSLSELKMGWKPGKYVVRTGRAFQRMEPQKNPELRNGKSKVEISVPTSFESLDRDMSGHTTQVLFNYVS